MSTSLPVPAYNKTAFYSVFDDFMWSSENAFGFNGSSANGGSSSLSGVPADNSYDGSWDLTTGTTNNGTGRGVISSVSGRNIFRLGGHPREIEWRVRIPVLTGTPAFIARVGFADGVGAGTPANAVYFSHSGASSFWIMNTVASSIASTQNTNVTVVANTWYKLKIRVNPQVNAVDFYINDIFVGSMSSNIPSTSSVGPVCSIEKASTSTASRTLNIDYFYCRMER